MRDQNTPVDVTPWVDLTDEQRGTILLQAAIHSDSIKEAGGPALTETDCAIRHDLITEITETAIYGPDGNMGFADAVRDVHTEMMMNIATTVLTPMRWHLRTAHVEAAKRGADNPHAVAVDLGQLLANHIINNLAVNLVRAGGAMLSGMVQSDTLRSATLSTHLAEPRYRAVIRALEKMCEESDGENIDRGMLQISLDSMALKNWKNWKNGDVYVDGEAIYYATSKVESDELAFEEAVEKMQETA